MWIFQSIITMICITCLYLIYKSLGSAGVSTSILLTYFHLFGLPYYFIHSKLNSNSFKLNIHSIGLIILAATIGYISNICHLEAIKNAPNPGYCSAIVDGKLLMITILSIFLFNSHVSYRSLSGIIICIIGMILIVI
jgi:uncharacterized membrane protein